MLFTFVCPNHKHYF